MLNNPFSYVKRATRTAWRKILHSAACILLVAALAFGGVMAVSPTARAWVQEVFTQWFETYSRFIFTGNPNTGTETGEWKTGYLPEGYWREDETINKNVTKIVYLNKEGNKIYLIYMPSVVGNTFEVDNEQKDYTELQINGNTAYLMEAREVGERSNLIWVDTDKKIVFKLMSSIDSKELICMAESIGLEG